MTSTQTTDNHDSAGELCALTQRQGNSTNKLKNQAVYNTLSMAVYLCILQLSRTLTSIIVMLDSQITIGHINAYPTMHHFGIPRHTHSMIAYKILTEYLWKVKGKLHCGNVVNMPYPLLTIPDIFKQNIIPIHNLDDISLNYQRKLLPCT